MECLVAATELARSGPAPIHHSSPYPCTSHFPNTRNNAVSPPSSPFSSTPASPARTPPSPPVLSPPSACVSSSRVAPSSAAPLVAPSMGSAPHLAAARAAASDAILSAGLTVPSPTFELAPSIIRATPLAEAPRRGDRVLPGRSDTSVAACYMLGGTSDAALSHLLAEWDLTMPRAARVKKAEAAYKDRVKSIIAALNERGARESRAENLAALRVCEVIADLLDGHKVREMSAAVRDRDAVIESLQRRIAEMERGRIERRPWESDCVMTG